MTSTKDIEKMLLSCVPNDMKNNGLIEEDLIKLGVIDMCSALGIENLKFEEVEGINDDGDIESYFVINPELTISQQRLAGYFCYILYLEKLKLVLNQDAINFSTLTFSIKGLEKRPEAINDQIYMVRRYLEDEISRVSGANSIVGTAVQYGTSEY